jgi:arylsulfatase A-like enzyme
VAKLIGATLPQHKIDGLDISDVITGQSNQSPHDVLYFYYEINNLEALRSGKWKLELPRTYRSQNGRPGGKNGKSVDYVPLKINAPELYDLDADPGQQHNVAAKHPKVRKKLLAAANRMRADLGDDLMKCDGPGRRQPGRVAENPVYPSTPAFPKAFDAKYRPGLPTKSTAGGNQQTITGASLRAAQRVQGAKRKG